MNPLQADNPTPRADSPAVISGVQPEQAVAALSEAAALLGQQEASDRRRRLGSLLKAAVAWVMAGQSSSWLASSLIHGGIVLALSLLMFVPPREGARLWLQGSVETAPAETLDLELETLSAAGNEMNATQEQVAVIAETGTLGTDSIVAPPRLETFETTSARPTGSLSLELHGDPLAARGGGVEGRRLENRRALAFGNGGNGASESAVEKGLAWLAAHQGADGGWRFNLKLCPECAGACRNSGVLDTTTAPTGLALLCFLGAGYTQQEGPYQETVAKGLYYLRERMVLTEHGGDLRDTSMLDKLGEQLPTFRKSGDMYSHGIATLAICEAYAMTGDEEIGRLAQHAIDYIVYAQHEQGGWRYEPKQPGDTTVSGWQLTALKSGLLGKLKVPREVWYRASEYFDSVQDDRGSTYGYQSPLKTRQSTTVVGLFSRMILGWPAHHPPLVKGLAKIAKQRPHQNHMYFNYYATQVLFHVGGTGWKRWNPQMREYLVDSQATSGHEAGSWYFDEEWSDHGGRLYSTALSILTLEVYYRYMPMYREAFVGESP
ncbi:MAG: terpene cyclase/mutase family protein [Planctomycetales bacterium]|nr:terpene cyclase/mutase family protein [Planctomycetales bacterium]